MVHTVKFFNNALSSTVIVNKNEGSREMFVSNNSCSPNSSFISNTGIISSDKRLVEFTDTEGKKNWRSHAVAGIYLCYSGAAEPSMFLLLLGSFPLLYNKNPFFSCLHSKLASSGGLCT